MHGAQLGKICLVVHPKIWNSFSYRDKNAVDMVRRGTSPRYLRQLEEICLFIFWNFERCSHLWWTMGRRKVAMSRGPIWSWSGRMKIAYQTFIGETNCFDHWGALPARLPACSPPPRFSEAWLEMLSFECHSPKVKRCRPLHRHKNFRRKRKHVAKRTGSCN